MSVAEYSEKGFLFFTNYQSKKGVELDSNPRACACFYWDPLERQVVIRGRVNKISRQESEKFFSTRPYEHQVASFISKQDQVVKNKQVLFDMYYKASQEFEKTNQVPMPENW